MIIYALLNKENEIVAISKTLREQEFEDGSFKMESLLDGKYLLDYFYPDSNGCLDVGSLEPLRFAKPWRTPLDTLVLQPGENVLEQLITLPKLP